MYMTSVDRMRAWFGILSYRAVTLSCSLHRIFRKT